MSEASSSRPLLEGSPSSQQPSTLQLAQTDKSSTAGNSNDSKRTVTTKEHISPAMNIIKSIQGTLRLAGQPCPPRAFQKSQQHVSRSDVVKGASFNVQKEAKLLRQRLDRVVAGYETSVTEHDKAQRHRLKILSAENNHLQKHTRSLEVENLKLSNDLLDHEELVADSKIERQELLKELQFYRKTLAEQKKDKYASQSQLEAENAELVKRNAELTEKIKELLDRETEREETVHELEVTLQRLRSIMSNKENEASFTASTPVRCTPIRRSNEKPSTKKPTQRANNHWDDASQSRDVSRTTENQRKQHDMRLRCHQASKR